MLDAGWQKILSREFLKHRPISNWGRNWTRIEFYSSPQSLSNCTVIIPSIPSYASFKMYIEKKKSSAAIAERAVLPRPWMDCWPLPWSHWINEFPRPIPLMIRWCALKLLTHFIAFRSVSLEAKTQINSSSSSELYTFHISSAVFVLLNNVAIFEFVWWLSKNLLIMAFVFLKFCCCCQSIYSIYSKIFISFRIHPELLTSCWRTSY